MAASLLLAFHVAELLTSVFVTDYSDSWFGFAAATVCALAMVLITFVLYLYCPKPASFGGQEGADNGYFRTPFVPFWPLIGIATNWYLISQLDWIGDLSLILLLSLTSAYYFGIVRSGRRVGWALVSDNHADEAHIDHEPPVDHSIELTTEVLPRRPSNPRRSLSFRRGSIEMTASLPGLQPEHKHSY